MIIFLSIFEFLMDGFVTVSTLILPSLAFLQLSPKEEARMIIFQGFLMSINENEKTLIRGEAGRGRGRGRSCLEIRLGNNDQINNCKFFFKSFRFLYLYTIIFLYNEGIFLKDIKISISG